MGKLFQKIFTDNGFTVSVGSRKIPGSYESSIKDAEIVILSVPIGAVAETVKLIRPMLHEEQSVVDFSSAQQLPGKSLKALKCTAVSIHPLFGPHVHDLNRQVFVFSKHNNGNQGSVTKLEKLFKKLGANVIHADSRTHDSSMALVQALIHSVHITSATVAAKLTNKKTASKKNSKVIDSGAISTPVSRLHHAVSGRVLSQPAELYANILMHNPEALKVIDAEITELGKLRKHVANKDFKGFEKMFTQTQKMIGDNKLVKSVEDTKSMLQVIDNK